MSLNDISTVVAIETATYPDPATFTIYEHELTKNPNAHYSTLQLATCNLPLVAYAGSWLIVDELQISMIAVHPDWQRNGLGKLLLLHEIRYGIAANIALVTLEVREGNVPARQLYESLGFETVGVRKNYYKQSGESAVLMSLMTIDESSIDAEWEKCVVRMNQFIATV